MSYKGKLDMRLWLVASVGVGYRVREANLKCGEIAEAA